ncbi:MAG: ABC transporter substrate-binding protein [Planctomycetota bacterium]
MRPFVALLLAACGAPPAPPARPERIVSLLPSFTEIVCALGAGGRLVAYTEHCRPDRDVPRLPWRDSAGAEAILRSDPHLVLRQSGRTSSDALRDTLERAGVRVLSIPSETVADVRRAIAEIGAALGAEARGREIVRRFDEELEAARAAVAGGARPSVLFVFGRDHGAAANVTAAGPGSFLDELIALAGGRNALAGFAQPYPTVSLEEILRLGPDVIIDNKPSEATEEEARAAWRRLSTVPAVRSGRVHAILDNHLLIPGPRLPEAVRALARLIHG